MKEHINYLLHGEGGISIDREKKTLSRKNARGKNRNKTRYVRKGVESKAWRCGAFVGTSGEYIDVPVPSLAAGRARYLADTKNERPAADEGASIVVFAFV